MGCCSGTSHLSCALPCRFGCPGRCFARSSTSASNNYQTGPGLPWTSGLASDRGKRRSPGSNAGHRRNADSVLQKRSAEANKPPTLKLRKKFSSFSSFVLRSEKLGAVRMACLPLEVHWLRIPSDEHQRPWPANHLVWTSPLPQE